MYCPHCGNAVPDQSSFCGKCGYKLTDDPAPVGRTAAQFDPAPTPVPAPTPKEPQSWSEYFLQRWKDFLSSGLVLSLLCCATLLPLLGTGTNPMSYIYEMMDSLGVPYYYYADALDEISGMMNSVQLISMVPGVLTVVGLWLMFADARKGGPRLSTAGMTIIQVLQIIGLVGACLAFGVLLITLLAAQSELSRYSYYSDASTSLGMMIGVVIIIGVVAIFLYAKILSAIGSVKRTLTTFTPCYDSIMFVGVLSIISGALSAVGVLGTLSDDFNLSLILSAAVPILYGVVAIAYKNLMEELETVAERMSKE